MHEERRARPIPNALTPPEHLKRSKDILALPPDTRVSGVIVSDAVYGLRTHYTGQRTVICLGTELGCALCETGASGSWQGWLQITISPRWKIWKVALTPGAVTDCARALDRTSSLFGCDIYLRRCGKTVRAPMEVIIQPRLFPLRGLNRPPSIVPWLERLYRLPPGALQPEVDGEDVCDLGKLAEQDRKRREEKL